MLLSLYSMIKEDQDWLPSAPLDVEYDNNTAEY